MSRDASKPPSQDAAERILQLERALATLTAVNRDLEEKLEGRSKLYRLIRDVTALASASDSIADVLHGAFRMLCERGGWTTVHFYYYDAPTATLLPSNVWEPEEATGYEQLRGTSWSTHVAPGDSLVGEVFDDGETRESTDLDGALGSGRSGHREAGLCRMLALPVAAGGSTFGVLELFSDDPAPSERQTVRAMELVAREIGQAILRKQTEALSAQIEAKEQHRIGRELHDGLGQLVTGLAMLAHDLHRRLADRGADESEAAHELLRRIDEAKVELRGLVRGLMPVYSGAEGLADALGRLVDETRTAFGVDCSFESNVTDGVRDHFAARHLYYIAQEALRNAARHARASRIEVRLEQGDRRVELRVSDDGVGLPAGHTGDGSGMRIMRHRAALLAARLVVESEGGRGTSVSCRVRIGGAFRRHSTDR